jgi:prophage regulatory protein
MVDQDDRFLRIRAVIEKTGCPKASIYRMIKEGTFPKRERIGRRAVGWRASRIARWMEAPTAYQDF